MTLLQHGCFQHSKVPMPSSRSQSVLLEIGCTHLPVPLGQAIVNGLQSNEGAVEVVARQNLLDPDMLFCVVLVPHVLYDRRPLDDQQLSIAPAFDNLMLSTRQMEQDRVMQSLVLSR